MKKIIINSFSKTHSSVVDPIKKGLLKTGRYLVDVNISTPIKSDHDLRIVTSWLPHWVFPNSILVPHGICEAEKRSHRLTHEAIKRFTKVFWSGSTFLMKDVNQSVVGFPKSDVLFTEDGAKEIEKTGKTYKVDELPYEQTILFNGPYLTETPILWEKYVPELLKLSKKHCFNVFIRPRDDVVSQKQLGGHPLMQVLSNYDNVRVTDCINNWTLFPFVDVSFSGLSSTIREFSAVKKPSFFLEGVPSLNYTGAVHRVKLKNFESTILKALNNPEDYIVSQKIIDGLFYKLDGKVVERIISEIDGLLKE